MKRITTSGRSANFDLRERIALANRSRLSVGREAFESVTSSLAGSRRERVRFIEDPTAYLKANSLPVSSCRLMEPPAGPAQTTETISSVINCAVTGCGPLSFVVLVCVIVGCDADVLVAVVVTAAGYDPNNPGEFAEAWKVGSDHLYRPGHMDLL